MSNNKLKDCWDAFERLKKGMPNNKEFLGETITNSLVSKEAGLDAGYVKNARPSHKELVDAIVEYNKKIIEGNLEKKIESLELKLKAEKEKSKKLKKERNEAFEREVLLFDKLIKLEEKVEKSNVLKIR
ncbi:hypothetical protein CWB76_01905 [Pseudoalteromonas sp. S1609]|uniref:hypothetical protein n=1 Tax=Pseudoalteromonas sp. S1609 TaxID=579505 RepID=UPI00110C0441|nr:hypothetical protein [Pseudoalteromonas sp. S1609]TMP72728.1 hypothetical protein CWB76_01905 [Pseudoalteromonas sp. S1609]